MVSANACAHRRQVAERLDKSDFDEKRFALDALQDKVAVDSNGAS
jgi:hypothetical protein